MSVFRRFSKPWRRTILVRLVIASYLSIDRHVTMSPVRRFPESFSYFGQHLRILVLTNLSCMFSFGRRDFPTVLQPSSTCQWLRLLTACCQRFTNQPIVFCIVRPTLNSLALAKRAVSAGSLSRQFFSSWMT